MVCLTRSSLSARYCPGSSSRTRCLSRAIVWWPTNAFYKDLFSAFGGTALSGARGVGRFCNRLRRVAGDDCLLWPHPALGRADAAPSRPAGSNDGLRGRAVALSIECSIPRRALYPYFHHSVLDVQHSDRLPEQHCAAEMAVTLWSQSDGRCR